MRYRLGIGLEWKKIQKSLKLLCLKNAQNLFSSLIIGYSNDKLFFSIIEYLSCAQNSGWLWKAVTFKRFEIQTWDWSRLKENSKIFKIAWTKKFLMIFSAFFVYEWRGASFLLIRVVRPIVVLEAVQCQWRAIAKSLKNICCFTK